VEPHWRRDDAGPAAKVLLAYGYGRPVQTHNVCTIRSFAHLTDKELAPWLAMLIRASVCGTESSDVFPHGRGSSRAMSSSLGRLNGCSVARPRGPPADAALEGRRHARRLVIPGRQRAGPGLRVWPR
jgi:hypothetical protein